MQATRYTNSIGRAFDVLKQNEDGTVDLGEAGELVIAGSKVTEEPQDGACVLDKASAETEAKTEPSKKKKGE